MTDPVPPTTGAMPVARPARLRRAGPAARPRVHARARRDRSTSAVPTGGRLAARRAAPPGAAVLRPRRAAPAGPLHVGLRAGGATPAGGRGRGPRRARHVRPPDPAARPGRAGRVGGHVPARLLRAGPTRTRAARRRDAAGRRLVVADRVTATTAALDMWHWAARSPRPPRCDSGTSPGPAATTTSSCAHRGHRSARI